MAATTDVCGSHEILVSIMVEQSQLHFNPLTPGRSMSDVALTHLPKDKMAIISYNIFKWIFMNKTFRILIQISLQFVPGCPIHNRSAFVNIMAWCQIGSHYLNRCWPSSLTHILVCCISDLCNALNSWVHHLKFLPCECHRTPLMISQHWLR